MDGISGISGSSALVSALTSTADAVPATMPDLLMQKVSVSVLKKALESVQAAQQSVLEALDPQKARTYSYAPGSGVQVTAPPARSSIDIVA